MLLIASILLLSIVFFFYAAVTVVFGHLAKKYAEAMTEHQNDRTQAFPAASLIVPTYNEERTIAKKIQNIEDLDYPDGKLEVIFVDGGSRDLTCEIIQQRSADSNRRRMKLIRQNSRAGYNSAIAEGLSHASNDIIVLTDAGSYQDAAAVRNLVGNFHDPVVGAVVGGQRVLNAKKGFVPKLEEAYWGFYEKSRMAESYIDSISVAKGECMAVRKEICEKALSQNKGFVAKGSFDMNVIFEARKQGYKAKFEPTALFFEYAPETLRERFQQKTRRAVNQIQSMLLFRGMFLNRRFQNFGLIILPLQYLSLLLFPWVFIFGSLTFLLTALFNSHVFLMFGALTGAAAVAFALKRHVAVSFLLSQISLALATLYILLGRTNSFIDIIPSTRQ